MDGQQEVGARTGQLPQHSTRCPKCHASAVEGATECPRCGIVFAKFEQRTAAIDSFPAAAAVEPRSSVVRDPADAFVRAVRAAMLLGLMIWTWQFARAPMAATTDSILHLPNLVFHEAGHVLFGFFGRFMTVLGGSLFQFALPLALAVAFLKQHNRFGAVVCVWWAGENLVDLAPYIADARALQLVLLGGKTGAEVQGHDWEYLLATLGWMRFDRAIGLWAYRVGLLIMTAALVYGLIHVVRGGGESVIETA